MKHIPKVSILLPVYNQSRWLSESICSCLGQLENDFELIIVDDGSTDKSLDIAEYYASVDSRVKVVKLQVNTGQAKATNIAASLAKGKYLAWHHADDNYKKSFLRKTLAAAGKGFSVVYGGYEMVSVEGEKRFTVPKDITALKWNRERFKRECYLCCGAMLYTKKAFDEVGGYDENFTSDTDWDFSLRVTKGRRVKVLPEVLFQYREQHAMSNRFRIRENERAENTRMMTENLSKGVYDV